MRILPHVSLQKGENHFKIQTSARLKKKKLIEKFAAHIEKRTTLT